MTQSNFCKRVYIDPESGLKISLRGASNYSSWIDSTHKEFSQISQLKKSSDTDANVFFRLSDNKNNAYYMVVFLEGNLYATYERHLRKAAKTGRLIK